MDGDREHGGDRRQERCGDARHDVRALLRDSAYAAVGLGDALAEAARSLPPADQAMESMRAWAAQRVETAGRRFERLVRRGRRTLGAAPLDEPAQRDAPGAADGD